MGVPLIYRHTSTPLEGEQLDASMRLRPFEKPTLLCCGGLLTNKGNPDAYTFMSGFAEIGAGLLGRREQGMDAPIDIVSLGYPAHTQALIDNMHAQGEALYSGKNVAPTAFARSFAETYLFPLLEDTGHRALPVEEIRRNLSKVRILSHSYGGVFALHVNIVLSEHMKALEVPEEDIRSAMRQVVWVSAGTPTAVGSSPVPFTALHVLNNDDHEAMNSIDFRRAAHPWLHDVHALLDGMGRPVGDAALRKDTAYYASRPLSILPVRAETGRQRFAYRHAPESPESLMYLAQPVAINGLDKVIPKASVSPYLHRSNAFGEFNDNNVGRVDEGGHRASTYFYFGRKPEGESWQHMDGHNGLMPRLAISSVLMNAMNRSLQDPGKTPDIGGLLELPGALAYAGTVPFANLAKAEKYRHRIEVARSTDPHSFNVPQVN